jgi:hypothetical protein
MPALASPSTWRTHPYRYRGNLFLLKPAIVFAARVNQASFTYSLAEFTYDGVTTGAYTDVQPGMTICFGTTPGAYDLGRQRVRKAFTSVTGYIGWSGRGKRDGEVDLADDAYVTVYKDFRIWAKTPRILPDGTMYKDFDVPVGTNGSQPPPVANAGSGVSAFGDPLAIPSEYLAVQLDGSASFAVAEGATITDYLWDLDDGTALVGTTADVAPIAGFPPGFRFVSLTVTDSNGKTHTARIPVNAAEREGDNAPISAL